MNGLLQSTHLKKKYLMGEGRQEVVLADVSLEIERGEFVSLMGPSGSGKSTLLYALSGMDRFCSGSVRFDGIELTSLSETELASMRLKKMGFIFQQIYLLKHLSIADNITLPGYLANKSSSVDIQQRASKLMWRMQIEELAEHDITQASGGQLQRASICKALINQPDILFGDEPTGALNSQATHAVLDILLEINHSGTTIFLVTHDLVVASRSERVLYLVDGKVIGECRLGKYQADASKAREQILSQWLCGMGF